jgi:ribonuclease P protein component
VLVRAPGGDGPPRVGLVVAKGGGGAVGRNRIKRRLRHAMVGKMLQPGTDYVIIANREVSEVPFAQLETWLTAALEEVQT